MIVCGIVAVNHQGVRLGKGAGYSDIEVGLLADAGLHSREQIAAIRALQRRATQLG